MRENKDCILLPWRDKINIDRGHSRGATEAKAGTVAKLFDLIFTGAPYIDLIFNGTPYFDLIFTGAHYITHYA